MCETLGAYIKEARKRLGVTQRELSEILGISPTYLSDVENRTHRRRGLSRLMINRISTTLKVNEDYLLFLANRWPEDIKERNLSEKEFIARIELFRQLSSDAPFEGEDDGNPRGTKWDQETL